MTEFIIPVHVENEKDLYATFDPSGLAFSNDLTAYLSDYMEDRRPGKKIGIEIHSTEALDKERLRKAFLLFVEKHARRNRHEIIHSNANATRLLLIGIIFIVIGIITAPYISAVPSAIISTIGSFSVWEASAVWLEILPALRKKDHLMKMMSDAEIRYVKDFTGRVSMSIPASYDEHGCEECRNVRESDK